ncbi:hypothetical protein MAPG_10584 [Magnaporthiopsis poae ATCC 64411]|uniref:Uncharacterized protein n=1 Tax=Magnaporthiopsis poae (strain ATCC 64411 / 73-15) TaxID=644358 RepID=A0A0C4ECZ5_MAGP6|nr:hypothetical protein MAPG_10584 [Magnaporthiopsis poae ATCC 64411]
MPAYGNPPSCGVDFLGFLPSKRHQKHCLLSHSGISAHGNASLLLVAFCRHSSIRTQSDPQEQLAEPGYQRMGNISQLFVDLFLAFCGQSGVGSGQRAIPSRGKVGTRETGHWLPGVTGHLARPGCRRMGNTSLFVGSVKAESAPEEQASATRRDLAA